MTKNYSRLNARRGRSAGWQWTLIGFVFSSFCWIIVVLVGLTTNLLQLSLSGALPTPTPLVREVQIVVTQVVTATDDPFLPTPTPIVVTATPNGEVQAPPVNDVAPATPTPLPDTPVPNEDNPTPTSIVPPAATQAEATAVPQQDTTNNGAVIGAPGEIPLPLRDIATTMVTVPGGTFTMGTTTQEVVQAVNECVNRDGGACDPSFAEDAFPAHQVTVDTFQIEITEVTYEQYVAFLNYLGVNSHRNGCNGFPCVATTNEDPNSNILFEGATYFVPEIARNLPVANVTWHGAQAYCNALGRRLPTEAEWERAARGDDGRIYPWGNEWDNNKAKTNRPRPSEGGTIGPVEVGRYPDGVSPYGVYDMAGNVAEWVYDWYSATYYQQLAAQGVAINPQGPPRGDPPNGTDKVVRGGSWDAVPFFARSVHRQSHDANSPTLWIGFRCAADGAGDSNGAAAASASGNDGVNLQIATVDPANINNSAPTLPPPATEPPLISTAQAATPEGQ